MCHEISRSCQHLHLPMTASCWRPTFGLDLSPFPRAGFQSPEIVVVIERALLRARELSSKEVYASSIASMTHGMTGSWKRSVGTSNLPPCARVDLVHIEVVEECGKGAVVVFATEKEKFATVAGRSY